MKWRGRRTSSNVQDRRGGGGFGRGGFGGGLAGRGMGRGGFGGGGAKVGGIGAVILVVAALFLGIDPSFLLGGGDVGRGPAVATGPNTIDDETEEFVSVVLADTEEVWHDLFGTMGGTYDEPGLVLFGGAVRSACGTASSAVGPFYCPGDERIYLDTDFFGTLARQLGAGGDFAAAYVIAHEVGHHVQQELGIMGEVNAAGRGSGADGPQVRLELQADCFAGVWARQADARFSSLEPGDIDEAMNAAGRIGDDALQRRSQGTVVPDSFTHGTSAQRARWFMQGFESGDPAACDTFGAASL